MSDTTITATTTTTDTSPAGPTAGDRWTSRKFFLALIALSTGSAALFINKFDPTNYIWLAGIVLGIHGGSNILDKKLNG
jgi:hypothetical protein